MAATLSISTVSTSDEAFKYPLPTVRQFHKQLHIALDEKNGRLRTLVGGSYRQLLGTADMIVDMRQDIGAAESKMARVAEGCGRSAVTKRVAGLGKFQASSLRSIEEGNSNLAWAAKMKVLGGCVLVVGRLLRGKDIAGQEVGQGLGVKLVTAAKVLVLSRLLVKSLGDEVDVGQRGIEGVVTLLEEVKRKLGGLRRRLLRNVEKILQNVDGDRNDLIHALCAHSLATSSGAKDVMRHFLHVRGEAMALAFEDDEEIPRNETKEESMLRALGLYTRTLLDVQALVPRRLSDALLKLKESPLPKDVAVKNLEGLRLDAYERWFGDEIAFFTPYVRHDDLDGPQAVDTLKGWAKKASQVLLQGFGKNLDRIGEFKSVVRLRTKIIETWILEGGKAKGFDASIMLDGLRNVINARLISLLEGRVTKLHLVGTEIEATLETWASSSVESPEGLWNEELLHMDLSSGAGQFKEAIVARVYGRHNAISRVIKSYETWLHLIDELFAAIEQLKSQRWEEDLESLEDDLSLENRNTLLSKDDPAMLLDHLEQSLEQAFKDLHQRIAGQVVANKESEHIGSITRFLLRVLRDIRAELPKRPDLKSFGLSLVPQLHGNLALHVSLDAIQAFTKSISQQTRVVGRALWEGTPELPVQPSPLTFKLLHNLASSMTQAGSDLWSATAVTVLKQHLDSQLSQEWKHILESRGINTPKQPNGHKEKNGEGENDTNATDREQTDEVAGATEEDQAKLHDILIQSLFDACILKNCLQPSRTEKSGDGIESLEKYLSSRIDLPSSSSKRVHRAADEYWKRTNLLFGILA